MVCQIRFKTYFSLLISFFYFFHIFRYYTLAHAVSERVTKQPSLLRAGTLRDYQLVGCLLLTEVIFIFIVVMSYHRRFKIHFVGYLGGPTVDAFFVQ